jgi:hypothetical protein
MLAPKIPTLFPSAAALAVATAASIPSERKTIPRSRSDEFGVARRS